MSMKPLVCAMSKSTTETMQTMQQRQNALFLSFLIAMSLTRASTRGLQPWPRSISGIASVRLVPSIMLRCCSNRQLHTKKSPHHMIRNVYPLRHNQVHQLGKLLHSGFTFPYMGPHVTWLLIRLWGKLNMYLTQLICGPWYQGTEHLLESGFQVFSRCTYSILQKKQCGCRYSTLPARRKTQST